MNSRPETEKTDVRCLVEAGAWRVNLAETNLDSTMEFEAWLAADARNRQAWERVQQSWSLFDEHATAPALLELRRSALAQARNAGRKRWSYGYFGDQTRQVLLAASFAVAMIAGFLVWTIDRPEVYRTEIGERRTVTLADGSQVQLDAVTELRVKYSHQARELTLVKGQASFDVASDVERPFSVLAAGRKVVATGTEFNVDLVGDTLMVTLLEGHVVVLSQAAADVSGKSLSGSRGVDAIGETADVIESVQPVALVAGQQLAVEADGAATIAPANVKRTMAWQSGQLVVDDEPLSSVIERINRYTPRTVSLSDAQVESLRISGVFKTNDVEGFVDTITSYLPVNAVRDGDEILLSHR